MISSATRFNRCVMSFDPYHKWLGILPKDQPPDHYRLLGIERFESDPDVISHAADKQMAHLKSLQAGENAELTQKLLNEISRAKVCLLHADDKAAYDKHLRTKPGAKKKIATAKALSDVSAVPVKPVEAPPTGSIMKARTLSGPCAMISSRNISA